MPMDSIVQLVKDYLIPGSSTFLLLGTAAGVFALFLEDRWRKWGRIWLTGLVAFYWVISSPFGATLLEKGLVGSSAPIESAEEVEGVEAIIILGGGSINIRSRGEIVSLLVSASALRALEGSRLYEMMDHPMVILSGGSNPLLGGGTPESILLLDMLQDAGIPEKQILLESESQSTREQAQVLSGILEDKNIDQFVLVTSPMHMRRSIAVFQSQGMDPIPGPAALRSEGLPGSGIRVLPSWVALDISQEAMREYLALGYYWVRGWLD
jgi:uncharacterized SAM-binding protein YcdF (DUF218 family)